MKMDVPATSGRRIVRGVAAGTFLLVAGCGGADASENEAGGSDAAESDAAEDCEDTARVETQEPTATDPIEAVHEYLGQEDPAVEGQEPDYAPWFGGAYGVPEEPGVVVVAVTDTCLVDPAALEDIVGEGRLHLIEVPLGFDELNALRSELDDRLADAGVPAALPIDSTLEGRIIRVTTPDPSQVPDELLASVPEGVVTVREGELPTPE